MADVATFPVNKALGEKSLLLFESNSFNSSTTIVNGKASLNLNGIIDPRIVWKATIVHNSGNRILVLLKTVVTDVAPLPSDGEETTSVTTPIESGGVSITFDNGGSTIGFMVPAIPFVTYEGV